MKYNEDTRVKIPSILHLTRLGLEYLSLKDEIWDENTNVFKDIFVNSLLKINQNIEAKEDEVNRLYEDISLLLDNDDLGKAFYERLTQSSGIKLIDFDNFENNTFNVVTELTCKNGDDGFRPDITLLINGMPLCFIEVKKPNNLDGIIAERKRMVQRNQNKAFKKFINITQIMVFSNNMEYDDEAIEPIQGAFYATASYDKPMFNYFREEEPNLDNILLPLKDEIEDFVLKDNNLTVIKSNDEFKTNKDPNTPTNRLSTSLFSKDRLLFMLKYAIAYVTETKLQKHIMRYPQIFATKAIRNTLENNVKSGIIWHTQGSGKTALAYFNTKYLKSYFKTKNVIPKFYFIVDRLDLLKQAKTEFQNRGLKVHIINSKEDFAKDIKSNAAIHNETGQSEITVVNIQKFEDDPSVVSSNDYDINIQRVYFLDEVHRSYNPKGSFLANLHQSDRNAIRIGLTGTPLLGDDYNSKALFGNYIHKYYYNSSIADGYTLRLIREDIETNYKIKLQEILEKLEILKGDVNREEVYSHKSFVKPMLEYIITDFENSRCRFGDNSIGGMVICDSSKQARAMFEIFNKEYAKNSSEEEHKVKTAELILHDVGSKKEIEDKIDLFKEGKVDFLFVYNMLLTGFDAKRLKKLYLGRLVRKHNLLQALTRVNRTYKDFRFGYVVDFADITKEFDATNKAYFDELQNELGDELQHYSNIFKSQEEITQEIEEIKDFLFEFNIKNAERFSQQINQIDDVKQMQEIVKILDNARSLYNLIRLQGDYELLEKIDFTKLTLLYREANNRLAIINLKAKLDDGSIDTKTLLNTALEDIVFTFKKVKEEELILADKLKDSFRKTREAFVNNFDKQDPKFISLKEELERLFKSKNITEVTQEEMNQNIGVINKIYEKIKELNRQNDLLKDKYSNDTKYARIHKRVVEKGILTASERKISEALQGVKIDADESVLINTDMLNNESYFSKIMTTNVINRFSNEHKIKLNVEVTKYINSLVTTEYINEFNGVNSW